MKNNKYKIAHLNADYSYLYDEYEHILTDLDIQKSDVMDVYFLYNEKLLFENVLDVYQEEKHMYYERGSSYSGEERIELEIPIWEIDFRYSYIVIYLENHCVLSRYGTTEIDYDMEKVYYYDGDKIFMTLEDIGYYIDDRNVYNLILSHFCYGM